ncbi:MAG: DUF1289 domain-containing protein [Alphaproteobacteria bacterium]|nr:DUF1289 domain-containing protein [Alphaproteobacteria bacterium]
MATAWHKIETPCKGICYVRKLDGEMLCSGCLRRQEEIDGWYELTDAERRTIMDELPARNPKQWRLMNPE